MNGKSIEFYFNYNLAFRRIKWQTTMKMMKKLSQNRIKFKFPPFLNLTNLMFVFWNGCRSSETNSPKAKYFLWFKIYFKIFFFFLKSKMFKFVYKVEDKKFNFTRLLFYGWTRIIYRIQENLINPQSSCLR